MGDERLKCTAERRRDGQMARKVQREEKKKKMEEAAKEVSEGEDDKVSSVVNLDIKQPCTVGPHTKR